MSVAPWGRQLFRCAECGLIQVHPDTWCSVEEERARYEEHINDKNDEGYKKHLCEVLDPFSLKLQSGAHILDFGAGPSPVASTLMRSRGFRVDEYDPIFGPSSIPEKSYDGVYCIEVAEHFRDPRKEFATLAGLLRAGGSLAIMTLFAPSEEKLDEWWYVRDKTHMVFYSHETARWISAHYQFSIDLLTDRIALFSK